MERKKERKTSPSIFPIFSPTFQRGDAHVEKNAVKNRHWDEPKHARHEDRDANERENEDAGQPILAHAKEARLLT